MRRIAIIGAGAAGLMTAATILESSGDTDIRIDLFEKNTTPGKKVILSGGGRCNVTTIITEKKVLATKYVRGWDYIKKSLGKFSAEKCRTWFELHGVPLKVEGERVFPVSDNGHDIVGVFEGIFAKYRDRITLHYGEGISGVSLSPDEGDGKFLITTAKGSYQVHALVIATGGNAYSHTGSSGDGYAFARALGHSITTLGPSLSSFLTLESWTHTLSGLSLEHAAISLASSPHERETVEGPLLLTHFGISGPLAFMLSSHVAWEEINQEHPKIVSLIPLGNYGYNDWEDFLKYAFQEHPKKYISSILAERLPRRFVDAFIDQFFSHIRETFCASIGKRDREMLSDLLGNGIPLTLLARRPGDEFVTAGGVVTDELDSETMQSRIHDDLYFVGEVLNVDGYTGGFSLQICWSSGYVAGSDIAKK